MFCLLPNLYGTALAGNVPITPHRASFAEMKRFIHLLGKTQPEGQTLHISHFKNGTASVTTNTSDGSWVDLHSLWIADVNNDGEAEYFWTTEGEGSGHYDYFDVYKMLPVHGHLVEIDFPLDGKNLPSNLADLPIEQDANGITYLRLEDIWAENAKGEKIYGGANSNAANGIACLVIVTQEYKWDKSALMIVSQQTQRTTYDISP